jgi:hypothetical protein
VKDLVASNVDVCGTEGFVEVKHLQFKKIHLTFRMQLVI